MDKLTAQKVLGVSPGASKKEIKKAYAAMLRMYHPEDYPREFQRIQEAYEVLIKGNGDGGRFLERKGIRYGSRGSPRETGRKPEPGK